jgi:phage shock protein A
MVYSWWGDSASVITIVEQQLGQPQAQVRALEKRIKALEAKLGMVEDAAEPASTPKAYKYRTVVFT